MSVVIMVVVAAALWYLSKWGQATFRRALHLNVGKLGKNPKAKSGGGSRGHRMQLWFSSHSETVIVVVSSLVLWKVSRHLYVPVVLFLVYRGYTWMQWSKKRQADLLEAGKPVPGLKGLVVSSATEAKKVARVQSQWKFTCSELKLVTKSSKEAPVLLNVHTDALGNVNADISPGRLAIPVESIAAQAGTIAESVGCMGLTVRPTETGKAALKFWWRDPIGEHLFLKDLHPGTPGRIVYGVREDGEMASIKWNLSLLLVALTEHGKSNIIHALIADLIRQGIPVRLCIVDPKGGMELSMYGRELGKTDRLVRVHKYATTPEEGEKLIEEMAAGMERRAKQFAAETRRSWVPTERDPLVILIVDELLELDDTVKAGAKSKAARIVRLGRAVGYVAWFCSQAGQVDTIGRLRTFIPQRICLAVDDSQAVTATLGNGALAAGANCHQIGVPGVGFSGTEASRLPLRFRAALVPDEDLEYIARGELPPGLPQPVEEAVVAPVAEVVKLQRRGWTEWRTSAPRVPVETVEEDRTGGWKVAS